MRRLISTALLAGVLLGAAACGAKTGENPTTAMTSSPQAAATVDKATSCAALNKDLDALKLTVFTATETMVKAMSDPSMESKAIEQIRGMFTEMQTVADKHLATAGDAELKAALTTLRDQVKAQIAALDAAGKDFDKVIEVDSTEFEAAGDKLEALCK